MDSEVCIDWQVSSEFDKLEEFEVCPNLVQTNCTTPTGPTPLSSAATITSAKASLEGDSGELSSLIYSNWSEFTTCTTSCGDGVQWRSRAFNCPTGLKCVAVNSSDLIDVRTCNLEPCQARTS